MGSRRKACISGRGTSSYRSLDERRIFFVSFGVQIRSPHYPLMYLTFRTMTEEDRIHVKSLEMRDITTLIMSVVLTLRPLFEAH